MDYLSISLIIQSVFYLNLEHSSSSLHVTAIADFLCDQPAVLIGSIN